MVYLYRGAAQRHVPSYDKAIDDFKKVIQLDPTSLAAHLQVAELYAACPVTRCRNPGKAIEHATKAIGLANHWRCHDVLAMAYAEAGRFADAVASVKEAIAAAPSSEKAGCQARLRLYEADTAFRIGQ